MKYKKISTIILAIFILGMIYLIKDIYKEDNIRLVENNTENITSISRLKQMYNVKSYEIENIYNKNNIRNVFDANSNKINENSVKDYLSDDMKASEKLGTIPKYYSGFEVIAKLEISKINLNTFVLEGYSEDAMNVCVTKFWGPNPNEIGNFCIIGHNYQKENMFNNLINLQVGDEIYLSDNKNGKFKYIIYDIYKVKEDNVEPIKQNTKNNIEMTLITCVNYTNNRLIIKARKEA